MDGKNSKIDSFQYEKIIACGSDKSIIDLS